MNDFTVYRHSMPGLIQPTFDEFTAEAVQTGIETLAIEAMKKEGATTFECHKDTTACHEAGHVVIETALGAITTKAAISKRTVRTPNGELVFPWLGITCVKDRTIFASTPESPAENDIIKAAKVYAGLAAEMVFDPDCKAGSSLNEVAECQLLCAVAGHKMQMDGKEIYHRIHCWVIAVLKRYSTQHKAIAASLLRNKTLRSRQLALLTKDIRNHTGELLQYAKHQLPHLVGTTAPLPHL